MSVNTYKREQALAQATMLGVSLERDLLFYIHTRKKLAQNGVEVQPYVTDEEIKDILARLGAEMDQVFAATGGA